MYNLDDATHIYTTAVWIVVMSLSFLWQRDRGFDPIDRRYFGIMEITVGYWITSCLLLLHVWGSMVFCWKATAFGLTKYDLS